MTKKVVLIHAIINTHEYASREFAKIWPAEYPIACFYTETHKDIVQMHFDPNSEYPWISTFPSVMVRVPEHTVPESVDPFTGLLIPAHTYQEAYVMLEPCSSYEHALEAITIYEKNIELVEAGQRRYAYPTLFLRPEAA